jgi:hypothetical protein
MGLAEFNQHVAKLLVGQNPDPERCYSRDPGMRPAYPSQPTQVYRKPVA